MWEGEGESSESTPMCGIQPPSNLILLSIFCIYFVNGQHIHLAKRTYKMVYSEMSPTPVLHAPCTCPVPLSRGNQYYWFLVNVCVWAQSCLTLCNPMDCSPPGSSVHWIFQARILEWFAISYSRGYSQSRDWTWVSCISCIGRQILYNCAPWEDLLINNSRDINISKVPFYAKVVSYSTDWAAPFHFIVYSVHEVIPL